MQLWRVGEFMKTQQGFDDTAREANLNLKSKIANFVRAFPDLFAVKTTAQGGPVAVTS